jgi:hypothetical protein
LENHRLDVDDERHVRIVGHLQIGDRTEELAQTLNEGVRGAGTGGHLGRLVFVFVFVRFGGLGCFPLRLLDVSLRKFLVGDDGGALLLGEQVRVPAGVVGREDIGARRVDVAELVGVLFGTSWLR